MLLLSNDMISSSEGSHCTGNSTSPLQAAHAMAHVAMLCLKYIPHYHSLKNSGKPVAINSTCSRGRLAAISTLRKSSCVTHPLAISPVLKRGPQGGWDSVGLGVQLSNLPIAQPPTNCPRQVSQLFLILGARDGQRALADAPVDCHLLSAYMLGKDMVC